MVKLENINFSYDGTSDILHNFNLSVDKAEIVAIKGASGSGKSTILRLIAGLESQQTGNIFVNGNLINNLPTNKRNTGFVFQSLALFPHLTVRKNIEFGLHQKSKSERNALVDEIVNKIEISDILDRYPHQISGGQKQRVAIARSLIVKPSVLLMDEPFTALDEDLKDNVRQDIKRILNTFKITTILVTHDKKDATALGARIIELN
jgi:iron(III) transport system ATP-binding protein